MHEKILHLFHQRQLPRDCWQSATWWKISGKVESWKVPGEIPYHQKAILVINFLLKTVPYLILEVGTFESIHLEDTPHTPSPSPNRFLFRNFFLSWGFWASQVGTFPGALWAKSLRQHYDRWCSSFPSRGRNGGTKNRRCRNKKQVALSAWSQKYNFLLSWLFGYLSCLERIWNVEVSILCNSCILYIFVKMLLAT